MKTELTAIEWFNRVKDEQIRTMLLKAYEKARWDKEGDKYSALFITINRGIDWSLIPHKAEAGKIELIEEIPEAPQAAREIYVIKDLGAEGEKCYVDIDTMSGGYPFLRPLVHAHKFTDKKEAIKYMEISRKSKWVLQKFHCYATDCTHQDQA